MLKPMVKVPESKTRTSLLALTLVITLSPTLRRSGCYIIHVVGIANCWTLCRQHATPNPWVIVEAGELAIRDSRKNIRRLYEWIATCYLEDTDSIITRNERRSYTSVWRRAKFYLAALLACHAFQRILYVWSLQTKEAGRRNVEVDVTLNVAALGIC